MSTRLILSLSGAAFALHGCSSPDLGPRPLPVSSQSLHSEQTLSGQNTGAWPQPQWWRAYHDPQLTSLIEEALANSPDVAAAMARIRQANGRAAVAGAGGAPRLDGTGQAGLLKQSYNEGIPAEFVPKGWNDTGLLNLQGSFDLDIWGKNRSALAQATSEAEATRVDAEQARLLLAASVVSEYFNLARLVAKQQALEQAIKTRSEFTALAAKRVNAGLDSDVPLRSARREAALARFSAEGNRQQIAATRNALAALLGAGPDRGLTIQPASGIERPSLPLPDDAGIALAGRRPDIIAARRRVAAASAGIDKATAAYLPDISLRGLIGLSSLGLSNLLDTGSEYGNATAAVSLPIFDGGRLQGQLVSARGSYDLAIADYNRAVIDALQDLADTVQGREFARARELSSRQAYEEAEKSADLAMIRYRSGLSTYLDALDARDRALTAQTAAIDARYQTLAMDVALRRALGGGYQEDTEND